MSHKKAFRFCCSRTTGRPADTHEFGRLLGSLLTPGDVVALIGELGSGKTCLIQGICAGLDVEDDVTSPTFTLINEYRGRIPVSHFDLYRLEDAESVLDIGYDDYIDGDGVCLIEWADKFPDILPEPCISVRLEIMDHTHREITVRGG